jgi:hypothetical protein
VAVGLLAAWVSACGAQAPGAASADSPRGAESPAARAPRGAPLEPLVPEIAAHPYRLDPGVRPFLNRFSLSPAYGYFGTDRLFALRATYNPEPWLGYEASIAHNPGHTAHALLHTVSAIVRRPFPGRIQPYLCGGYGMIVVYPGHALNATPVTHNALAGGGGLEIYIRSDLALRADMRQATVFGEQKGHEGLVAYGYSQGTIGLAFYRSIQP